MSRISVTESNDHAVITVKGSFVFDRNREFRETYSALPPGRPVTVDLAAVDYMDSAGLGMLLRLREHAGNEKESVTLTGVNDTLRRILEVVNFGQMFTIR